MFYLPEHKPSEREAQTSLVEPEAQVLTGPTTVDFMKGLLSLLNKYGFTNCFGGLTATNTDTLTCQSIRSGHELLNAVGQPCEQFCHSRNC